MLTLESLQNAVGRTAAAFRCVSRLEPAGGPGDKVFPPTYAGGVYAVENRRICNGDGNEEVVPCVLLDSVQSQANRMEVALQDALDRERISIPVIEVDFSSGGFPKPLHGVTSLLAPHRLADAILRDSVLEGNGTRFSKSEHAQAWGKASLQNATPIYRLCPTALVFGLWGSPKKPGGMGVKFERTIVSEIVGVGALTVEKRSGFRIDPLEIRSGVRILPDEEGWSLAEDAKQKGTVAPSEINHGNIIFESGNAGVRFRFAEQTTVLSLPALRRLKFPRDGGISDSKVDDAARTVLAALALCGATLAFENGLDLRSRCLLVPSGPRVWEILDKPGEPPTKVTLDGPAAIDLLSQAVAAAEQVELEWMKEPLKLKPSPELVALVRKSQELAAAEAGEGGAP
jgi:CRISPR-associated protein Csb1